jgi:TonB family protein
MKTVAALCVVVLLAGSSVLAGTDPAVQQLLADATKQADIFQADASPFQLDVDFTAQLMVPTPGHLILKWDAHDRWWRKVTVSGFQQIEIRDGDKLYISRNAPATPMFVRELVDMVQWFDTRGDFKINKEKRVDEGAELTCVQTGGKRKERDICLHPVAREVASVEWKQFEDEVLRYQYAAYFEFRGHRYPGEMTLLVNGIKSIRAHVGSLATSPLDQGLLVPPKGAIERKQCEDFRHAVAVKTPDPMYPKSASENRMMGDTAVSMTILTDGTVGDIQVVGSAVRSMDEATLHTLKSWKFKPAMCGSEPVVSDIQVVVSFRLR